MAAVTRWQEWTSFMLGLWLALSPWVLDHTHMEAATTNAVFVGLALALAAHFEVSCEAASAEWLNVMAGAWLVAAPEMLGFTSAPWAAANSIAVGTLVVALAASAMSLDKEIGKLWHKMAGQ